MSTGSGIPFARRRTSLLWALGQAGPRLDNAWLRLDDAVLFCELGGESLGPPLLGAYPGVC